MEGARETHTHTGRREEGGEERRGKKHPEGDRWGWSDGDTITVPSRRKEYNLSDTKKQHQERYSPFPTGGKRSRQVRRVNPNMMLYTCGMWVCVCLYTNTFTAWLGNVALEPTLTAVSLELRFALLPKSKAICFSLLFCFITMWWWICLTRCSCSFPR